MKALTVWEPYASLIANGIKRYEFRNYPAPKKLQGERIAIHAGARPPRMAEVQELIAQIERGENIGLLDKDAAWAFLRNAAKDLKAMPTGHVLCSAILGEPIKADKLLRSCGIPVEDDAGWNWAWPLREIKVLTPTAPARGMMGFWDWQP